MRIPGLILGYHGCDQDVAESILAGRSEVRSSENSYDWLGSGAYFWENNPARALSWAALLARSKSRKIRNPAVVGAIIDPGNCLDLAEESSLELVKAAFEGFRRLSEISDELLPVNEPGHKDDADLIKRHLDCAVLNFLHETREVGGLQAYQTVRAPFIEGRAVFPGSKLKDKTHVQWCVRDPDRSIIAYFRPRDPEATEV
jgi:hypothetical protein